MQPRVRTETAPSDLSQAAVPKYVRGCGIYFQGFGDEIWCFVRGSEYSSHIAGFWGEGVCGGVEVEWVWMSSVEWGRI
jgi:hypothetical protein